MKRLHQIRYPTNRADAIRYARSLDAEWASILSMPDPRRRGKEILRLIRDVQSVLKYLENHKKFNTEIEASHQVIQRWLRKHWKGNR